MRKVKFTEFILKNSPFDYKSRIPHFEDLILYTDINKIKDFISNINKSHITLKCDGSPAIIFGILDNRFFVSTKSFFNKTPIINYSIDDIYKNHKPPVAKKLEYFFNLFDGRIEKGIYGCDLLYTTDEKNYEIINNTKGIIFKSNIINYFVPTTNPLYSKIEQSKIGIVIHTRYNQDRKAIYNFELDIQLPNEVFILDNLYTKEIVISDIDDYQQLSISDKIAEQMISVINFSVANDLDYYEDFKKCVKEENIKRKHNYTELINFMNTPDFSKLLLLHKEMTNIKNQILKQYEFPLDMYVKKGDNYQPMVKGEGFVFVYKDIICKMIDRKEFSKYNFNLDKEWDT